MLNSIVHDAERQKFFLEVVQIVKRKQCRVPCGANLIGNVASKQAAQACQSLLSTVLDAGDVRVIRKGRLHIETDPVKQGQQRHKALRMHARRVQAGAEAEFADILDGIQNGGL